MMENCDLETLYFPSKWSPRLSPDEIVENHIKFAEESSAKARELVPNELNIPYGELNKEKIDIFGTDLSEDAPIVIFVHGGYWQEERLLRDTYHFIAPNFHENGIKSIFVGYELCPTVSMYKIVQEIETALVKCLQYAKDRKSKGIHLMGYSAGAQLVALLFTNFIKTLSEHDREYIKSVFLIAGLYDLKEIPQTSVNKPLKMTLEDAKNLSPLLRPFARDIFKGSFWVITAENDSPIFKAQADEFHSVLKHSNMNTNFLLMKDVDHFNIMELLMEKTFKLFDLILHMVTE